MEGLEESQVNDRSILEATVIERQDHSGRIRFKTTLPSGRDLNSEWIQESDKTKAGILWAEAVRGQIVADSQEAAAKAKRVLREVKAAQPVAPRLLGVDGQALPSSESSTPAAVPSRSPTPAMSGMPHTVSADPAVYVRTQHTLARQRLDELKEQLEQIKIEYADAKKAEAQWFGLMQAMGGVSGLEQDTNNQSRGIGVSGGGGVSDVDLPAPIPVKSDPDNIIVQ